MPEDYLLEAKRIILGASRGAFYGNRTVFRNYVSYSHWSITEPLIMDVSFLHYFRVSKRTSILCGRGESCVIYAIVLYSMLWSFLQCGNPMEELNCNVCGDRIGGINARLRHDNRVARR